MEISKERLKLIYESTSTNNQEQLEEWFYPGSQSNACIFDDGKFAEIIKEESNNNFTYKEPTASIWKKTMDLRWSDPTDSKVLQQKWKRTDNGETMWKNI